MLNGAIAGVAARTMSAPIDLLKIRFQMKRLSVVTVAGAKEGVHGSPLSRRGSPYTSILSAIRSVYKHEGILDPFGKGVAGAMAAMGATFKYYKGMFRTVEIIFREEGLRGFYKGLGPSLGQVMPYMGLAFASFEWAKRHLEPSLSAPRHSDMLAGAFSGFFSKFCLMPVDVVRKRLQIQGSPYRIYVLRDLPVYTGLFDCVRSIWRAEGVRGYFSGLFLALLKSVPATMTTFVVYGFLKRRN